MVSINVDPTLPVAVITAQICEKLGIPNADEYGIYSIGQQGETTFTIISFFYISI